MEKSDKALICILIISFLCFNIFLTINILFVYPLINSLLFFCMINIPSLFLYIIAIIPNHHKLVINYKLLVCSLICFIIPLVCHILHHLEIFNGFYLNILILFGFLFIQFLILAFINNLKSGKAFILEMLVLIPSLFWTQLILLGKSYVLLWVITYYV